MREGDGLKKLGAYIRRNEQGEVVEVVFNFNDITDAGLVHLKGMTNLRSLRLSGPKITDAGLAHLKDLTNLQTLNLRSTQVTDAGLVHLKGLTNLRELDLNRTKVTDAGLVHLKGMNLKRLIIPDQAQTDTGLKHYLAAIKPPTELHLNKHRMRPLLNWSITDSGLVHLKGLTNLKSLSLYKTQITDAGIAELQKALPNCKITK